MSNSPCSQASHGTGSGLRTTPATRSPEWKPLPGGAARTLPRDSWPSTSHSFPGGAQPYSPRTISRSVPQTPSASPSTSSSSGPTTGSGTSVTVNDPARPGSTVNALMPDGYPALSGSRACHPDGKRAARQRRHHPVPPDPEYPFSTNECPKEPICVTFPSRRSTEAHRPGPAVHSLLVYEEPGGCRVPARRDPMR